VQSDHRYQRGGLEQHQPVVAEARQGMAHHLRQQDAQEHLLRFMP
jgi:hypothetical protein